MKKLAMQSAKRAALAMVLGFGVMVSANAGLVGVKTIEIANSISQWLQVAEVQAFNMLNVNEALASNGATATAPDTWDVNSTPAKAIDGSTNGAFPNIFHEGSPLTYDTLTISLASAQELNLFEIWGRTDCCSDRDVYNVVFKDSAGAILYSATGLDASVQHFASLTLPNTVPEPTSLALFGLALMAAGSARRAAKRKG